jgi:hypothetical protein
MSADLFPDKEQEPLLRAFAWWEKKRLLYNIIVGFTGILVWLSFPIHTFLDSLSVILYGVIANLFYSTGFLLEVVMVHYFKKDMIFEKWRPALFWTGLIFSMFVTVMTGVLIVFTTIFNF